MFGKLFYGAKFKNRIRMLIDGGIFEILERYPARIFENLIHERIEPIFYLLLPIEQAGFRRRRSSADQAVLLNQTIKTNPVPCL